MTDAKNFAGPRHIELGVAILKDEGMLEFANPVMRKWLGKWKGQRIQEKLNRLISEEQRLMILSSGKPMEWSIVVDELHLQMHAYPYIHDMSQASIFMVAYNIKPVHLLEAQFQEMKAIADELEAVFQNSYDAIYISDANGITLKTNDAIERLTGIPKEYYIGKDLRYLEKRGIVQKSVTFEVLKEKKPVTVIQENSLGKVILLTGSPIFNEQGEITRIVTNLRDISELNRLREKLLQYHKYHSGDEPIIYASKYMEKVIELASRVAKTDTTVLLLGESGVGKEVIARLIHRNSGRYENGAFIKVNCGAIPQELLESELFGYESGAFTGAKKGGKPGMFELAHEGTLFLDEIGELPLHLQVKLLRVLQEQEFTRVGGVKPMKVNVRIIAATNRNLKKMVADGNFREDLYYRIYVVPIEIPPLRKRKEDIRPLLSFYLDIFNRKYQASKTLKEQTIELLQSYEWPGNVRELANFIERLFVISPTDEMDPEHLQDLLGLTSLFEEHTPYQEKRNEEADTAGLINESDIDLDKVKTLGFQAIIEQMEMEILTAAYKQYGSSYEVGKALQLSQSTAIRKAYKYGIRTKPQEEG
ncbi:sigma 54-interacting transcriptional regulator [Fodinisporobacter ferrooxydans]|uniref:HTH-type transcriptional regulatory protein TyrR n=1 Tax=Fodinisporobacter ferrooxydans TaxID=2901836 RepID=A0ABY4CET3_9BACL|nr:sigma 54-interacting transcriptional regulator [Alicyclobacillaceae bacterium MYW30-H2]